MSEYSQFGIKQLWYMVDAAKRGLQPSYEQVAAFRKAQQMLSAHAHALEKTRDQLAAKWPPEFNGASAAYLAELDRLIEATKETALACSFNVFHISMVSDAILQAHEALEPLHDEFVANETKLANFDSELDSFANGASLIPGGRTIAKGVAKVITPSPVASGRQDALTVNAQQVMVTLAGAARDGATHLSPPVAYQPPATVDYSDKNATEYMPQDQEKTSASARHPPAILFPPHSAPSDNSQASRLIDSRSDSFGPPLRSGPALATHAPGPSHPGQGDPAPFSPGASSSSDRSSVIGPFPSSIPGVTSWPPGRSAISDDAERSGKSIPLDRLELPAKSHDSNDGSRTSTIGSRPARINQVHPGASPATPSGGVIGQYPGTGHMRSASGRASSEVSNGAAASGLHSDRETSTTRPTRRLRDPDNLWEMQIGVDPVIAPDLTPSIIDPGPGIIGMDR